MGRPVPLCAVSSCFYCGDMDLFVEFTDGFGESAESLLLAGLALSALAADDEPCDVEGCPGPPEDGGRCFGMRERRQVGSACLNPSEWFRVLLFEQMVVLANEPDGIPMDVVVYACHQIGKAMQDAARQVEQNGPLVDWVGDMTILREAFYQGGEQGLIQRMRFRWKGRRADKRAARRAAKYLSER